MKAEGGEVQLEIWIQATPETVFALLTDASSMKLWLAHFVEADPRPGGMFRIWSPTGTTISGIYLEAQPHRRVVFTWGGVEGVAPGQSTVEFELEAKDGGTLVKLRHYGLPGPAVGPHHLGWVHSGLVKLRDASEGRKPERLCLTDLEERRAAG
jgi:uncharacterized protein YndB with AHSA1/START domain